LAAVGGEPVIVSFIFSLPFAHAGHVLIDLPIFLGPVLMMVIWLTVANWRDKRKGRGRS
jgi:hypothetical protein